MMRGWSMVTIVTVAEARDAGGLGRLVLERAQGELAGRASRVVEIREASAREASDYGVIPEVGEVAIYARGVGSFD